MRPVARWLLIGTVLTALVTSTSCSSQGSSASKSSAQSVAASTTTSLPLPTPPLRQWLNLSYAHKSSAEELDLYVPTSRPVPAGGLGLVVYVHGGGWLAGQGDKANAFSLTVRNLVLSFGYAIASVNYRLSNEAHLPAQIQDVKSAVRWLRAHAGQYGYNPNRIAAVGDSAGGQLVALLGTSEAVASLEGANLGNAHVSSGVGAAVVLYPDIDLLSEQKWLSANPVCEGKFSNPDLPGSAASKYLGAPIQTVPEEAKAADPITYIAPGKDLPQFLIAAGTADCTVPYQGSVELFQALVKVGGPSAAQLILEQGYGHYPDFDYDRVVTPMASLLAGTIGLPTP